MPVRIENGLRLAWREQGEGEPALLLHCVQAEAAALSDLMDLLGDRLRMVAPDLPGYGATEFDKGRKPLEQAVGNAQRFLALRSHVIGHSYGAVVALRLAIEKPERVASLVLIEPVLFASLHGEDPAAYARLYFGMMSWEPLFLARWGPGGAWLEGKRFHPRELPLNKELKNELQKVSDFERELFQGWDAQAVAGLRCPVLLIGGSESPACVSRVLDVVEGLVPQAKRVVIPGAGHLAPMSHPEPVAAVIRTFLDQSRKSLAE